MLRAVALVALMAMAQPAAAIQFVQLAGPAGGSHHFACAPAAAACTAAKAQHVAARAPVREDRLGSRSLIAGLVGLLVLGLVFGRRRSGLPEVVS